MASGIAGGTPSKQDKATFTEGTDYTVPIGAVVNDTLSADVAEDKVAAPRMTPKRGLHANLRDSSGNEILPALDVTLVASNTLLTSIANNTDNLESYTDTIESLLTTLNSYVDTIEALIASTNGYVDGLEDVLASILSALSTVTVSIPALATPYSGRKTVTTAGTQVALASSQAVKTVTIKALSTNGGMIYVGDSSVSSSTGFQLSAGDTITLDISNLATIYINSSVNGEGVTYIGAN